MVQLVIMINELVFFLQTIIVALVMLVALALGKEAVIAGISLLFVLANIFVVKQITLFGFEVTSADVYIIGAVLGFNLLHEYFGNNIAKKTIWISFFISAIVLVMSQLHLRYIPNMHDITQRSFMNIFGFLPRIVGASFAAHIGAQYLRLFLYGLLKRVCGSRYLVARNFFVTIVEQAVDTAIFGFIGLYGIVYSLTDVFFISFVIKLLAIVCTTPWLVLARFAAASRSSLVENP